MKILVTILTVFILTGFKPSKTEPTSNFINIVKAMKNDNWIDDHIRLTEVSIYPEIDRDSKREFNGLTFYPIDYKNSAIYSADLNSTPNKTKKTKALSSVNSIWVYFYRKEPQNKMNVDGLIEQWEFENDTIAKKALLELKEIAPLAYFNTQPYYFTNDNFIYIFHTRAMAFSYEQKPIYEMFKLKVEK